MNTSRVERIAADLTRSMSTTRPVHLTAVEEIPSGGLIYSRTTRDACQITYSISRIQELSDPAVAFTIAHELAHHSPAMRRRRRRRILISAAAGLAAAIALWLAFGDVITSIRVLTAALGMYVVWAVCSARLNRGEEYECDRAALEKSMDPNGAHEALNHLHSSPLTRLLGAHPTPGHRAARLHPIGAAR